MRKKNTHPEFEFESSELEKTIRHMKREYSKIDDFNPTYDRKNELYGQYLNLTDKQKALLTAMNNIYFARLDFRIDGEEDGEQVYITKIEKGGALSYNSPVKIIAWNAPIASIYYQSSGRSGYSVGGRNEEVTVYLRRNLEIKEQILEKINDIFDKRKEGVEYNIEDFLIDPDDYLKKVLDEKRGKPLTEVITSIQEEQNRIMRSDSNQILIVQGSAGCGKTTIALHRVAILLYPNEQQQNKKICIIGSNPFFLRFISQVLPSLEIDDIPQYTFMSLSNVILGNKNKIPYQDTTLQLLLDNSIDVAEKNALRNRSKFKGSIDFLNILRRLSEKDRIHTNGDVVVYPIGTGSINIVYTLTEDDLDSIIKLYSSNPVNAQKTNVLDHIVNNFMQHHRKTYKAVIQQLIKQYNTEPSNHKIRQQIECYYNENKYHTEKELKHKAFMPLEKEIKQLVQSSQLLKKSQPIKLYITFLRDIDLMFEIFEIGDRKNVHTKIQKAQELYNSFVNNNQKNSFKTKANLKDVTGMINEIDLVIKSLKTVLEPNNNTTKSKSDLNNIIEDLQNLKDKLKYVEMLYAPQLTPESLSKEDMAPIIILYYLLEGNSTTGYNFDHIIVDEAQDISPLEMWILRSLLPSGSMTILGDVAQSIYSYRGVTQWSEFDEVFNNDTIVYEKLMKSYRSTFEIMTFANQILKTPILKNYSYEITKPFKRHGDEVKVHVTSSFKESIQLFVDIIDTWINDGLKTIALITKTEDESNKIYSQLKNQVPNLDLIVNDNERYNTGLAVIPAFLAKGVEFDGCIITNASVDFYPNDDLHGRLFYVACTRALHRLIIVCLDKPAIHIPEKYILNLA